MGTIRMPSRKQRPFWREAWLLWPSCIGQGALSLIRTVTIPSAVYARLSGVGAEMGKQDRIAAANERHWEWAVKKGAGCTVPWLDLGRALLRRYANGELNTVPERIERPDKDEPDSIQFRHHMGDIFNGLLDLGLRIQQVQDSPHLFRQNADARPGSWDHSLMYLGGFAIVATKG